MRKLLVFAMGACALVQAMGQTNVGVSIGIHQPGFYGRIDIGDYPPPVVVYPQPVMIIPSPVAVYRRPIYLYVPPGHQRDWAKHCHRYRACDQPVYFVEDRWMQEHYQERRDDQEHDRRGNSQKKKRKD